MNTPRVLMLAALLAALPSTALAVGGTGDEFRVSPSAHDGTGALQLIHPATGGRGAGFVGGALIGRALHRSGRTRDIALNLPWHGRHPPPRITLAPAALPSPVAGNPPALGVSIAVSGW